MDISFLHAGLAAGAALAAVPVILHLILRQKPKHVAFPALRLVRLRHRANLRKLRLRHLLLLAARMAVIALVALALARPRIGGLLADEQQPVAAALVFDTSLSMDYRVEGKSRLEAARGVAEELLKKLPDSSQIVVIDSTEPAATFSLDLGSARQRLRALAIRPVNRAVNRAAAEAYKLLAKSDKPRKELYVFSDLARSGWDSAEGGELQRLASAVPGGVATYLIDVGAEQPQNVFLGALATSHQVLARQGELVLRTSAQTLGASGSRRVGLFFDEVSKGRPTGQGDRQEAVPRYEQTVNASGGQSVPLEFTVRVPPGLHQGEVRLARGDVGGDPLAFDDTRYVTVEVRPAVNVLLVSPTADETLYLREALAAFEYQTRQITPGRLVDERLEPFQVVCLVDVPELTSESWQKLEEFVQGGHGLAVMLGRRVVPDAYNDDAAQRLLPAQLAGAVLPKEAVHLAPNNLSQPVLEKFKDWGVGDLVFWPVRGYVRLRKVLPEAQRILNYSDGNAALAGRTIGAGGRGRVLLWTTAADYRPEGGGWTDLPLNWSYLALVDQMVQYLAGYVEETLNYELGTDVILSLKSQERFGTYVLEGPSGEPQRITREPSQTEWVISAPQEPGQYQVVAAGPGEVFRRGFSVNVPVAESELSRLDTAALDAMFGKDRYGVARDTAGLQRAVGQQRIGREIFPLLMLLVVLVFALEQLLANRFYAGAQEEEQRTGARPRRWWQRRRGVAAWSADGVPRRGSASSAQPLFTQDVGVACR